MKVITVRQPYADALVRGWKRVENRTYLTKYRGWTAIHAGKDWDQRIFVNRDGPECSGRGTMLKAASELFRLHEKRSSLCTGCIIGIAWLDGCYDFSDVPKLVRDQRYTVARPPSHVFGDWYWWHFTKMIRLPDPIPRSGTRKIRQLEPKPLAAIRHQLGL